MRLFDLRVPRKSQLVVGKKTTLATLCIMLETSRFSLMSANGVLQAQVLLKDFGAYETPRSRVALRDRQYSTS